MFVFYVYSQVKYVLEGQEVLGFLIETRVLRTAYDLVYLFHWGAISTYSMWR